MSRLLGSHRKTEPVYPDEIEPQLVMVMAPVGPCPACGLGSAFYGQSPSYSPYSRRLHWQCTRCGYEKATPTARDASREAKP